VVAKEITDIKKKPSDLHQGNRKDAGRRKLQSNRVTVNTGTKSIEMQACLKDFPGQSLLRKKPRVFFSCIIVLASKAHRGC
jgi:hypothetical protein